MTFFPLRHYFTRSLKFPFLNFTRTKLVTIRIAIWSIAWRCTETPNGIIVNLCNYRQDAVRVMLWRDGAEVSGMDLLNGEQLSDSFTLSPLQVRLVLVK